MISGWKKTAISNMASAFGVKAEEEPPNSQKDVEKLDSVPTDGVTLFSGYAVFSQDPAGRTFNLRDAALGMPYAQYRVRTHVDPVKLEQDWFAIEG